MGIGKHFYGLLDLIGLDLVYLDKHFFDLCDSKFRFLVEEYRFTKTGEEESALLDKVTYKNQTTGVVIGFERGDGYIYVELHRLVDGEINRNPIIIRHDSKLNHFGLHNLISLRMPDLKFPSDIRGKGKKDQLMEEIITKYAYALRECATDILRGDFSVFRELDKVVKSRIR